MKDRRRSIRWQINQQAKVKLEGAYAFIQCFIKDINFTGLQISLRMKLPEDTFLKFNLVLSEEATLDIEAWVVWHKRRDDFNVYGLRFTQINEENRGEIYKFLYKYFPEEVVKRWGQKTAVNTGGETMQDKRIFERFPASLPLRFIDLSVNKESQAQTQDISAKGIGLMTDKELSPQTPLEMWLDIPDHREPLYTRGEVAWSKLLGPDKYRVGVNLERADLMGIARILRS
ncbi:MAG: PilZ domain-containing protein [Candidatus Omnitrophica bacterium]|nr:PilZ domain-containing protein [Candidatus Omnitrophota bacterium]MDD5592078.1 PilZ domain-containing protein [Candidatus Omnitrophota bacterium]